MNKQIPIAFFGSSPKLAKAVGLTRQAVHHWPDELNERKTNEMVGLMMRHWFLQDEHKDVRGVSS